MNSGMASISINACILHLNHMPHATQLATWSVGQCFCSDVCDSQQQVSPIGFLFWNFRHRLVRYLLVFAKHWRSVKNESCWNRFAKLQGQHHRRRGSQPVLFPLVWSGWNIYLSYLYYVHKQNNMPGCLRIFVDWASGRSDFIMASGTKERGFFHLGFLELFVQNRTFHQKHTTHLRSFDARSSVSYHTGLASDVMWVLPGLLRRYFSV